MTTFCLREYTTAKRYISATVIISDIEEAFDIIINLEEITLSELNTIGSIVEMVKKFVN